MARKYDALADYLRRQDKSCCAMSFAEIEGVIGGPLPRTAHSRREWWDNDRSPTSHHVQSKFGWLAAGWIVESRDLDRELVTFCRQTN